MRKWNLALAKKMYAKGKTLKQVGKHFGITRTTTSLRLRAAGVKTRGVGAVVAKKQAGNKRPAPKKATKPAKRS
jgi:hypothetical protein